jgi:hypothetical protein
VEAEEAIILRHNRDTSRDTEHLNKDTLHRDMVDNSPCMYNNSDPVVEEEEQEQRDVLPGKSRKACRISGDVANLG